MKKYYGGIGSRTSPPEILEFMTKIAQTLYEQGYNLRSGGAAGADEAFENGVNIAFAKEHGADVMSADCFRRKEILRPKHATIKAIEIAMEVHPAPQHCNDYVRKLHGRNVMIILGEDLITPVEFVMAWTPGGKTLGGTGLGLRLAERERIKVYNLFDKDHLTEVHERFLND